MQAEVTGARLGAPGRAIFAIDNSAGFVAAAAGPPIHRHAPAVWHHLLIDFYKPFHRCFPYRPFNIFRHRTLTFRFWSGGRFLRLGDGGCRAAQQPESLRRRDSRNTLGDGRRCQILIGVGTFAAAVAGFGSTTAGFDATTGFSSTTAGFDVTTGFCSTTAGFVSATTGFGSTTAGFVSATAGFVSLVAAGAGSGAVTRASFKAFTLAQSRRAVARCEHKVESFTVGVTCSSSASAAAVVSWLAALPATAGAGRDAEVVTKGVVT